MPKKVTLRKKNKRVSLKHYKKISKNNKKHRKTFRNKIFKGGFNSAQFAGALAVAAAMGMNKIVLIPNEAGTQSRRYDFEIDANNKPKLSAGRFTVPGTRSTINIRNFNIFVGSTTSDLLIQMEGNDSVIKRLAAITQTIAQPQNAIALITNAEQEGIITQSEAENLTEEVRNNSPNNMLTNVNVEPESKDFENIIKLILDLLGLFFIFLFNLIKLLNDSTNQPPSSSAITVTPQQTSDAVVAVVNNTPQAADQAAEDIKQTLDDIGSLPQFRDIRGETIEPPTDNNFKCVNPYDRTTATTRDRLQSCNRIGPPNVRFVGRSFPGIQNCVSECYT